MKGGKYFLLGAIVLVVVLFAYDVYSPIKDISGSVTESAYPTPIILYETTLPQSVIINSGLTLDEVNGAAGVERDAVDGVSHSYGEVSGAIYADYLKVSGTNNPRLFGVRQLEKATYVIPLLKDISCNDMCKYTLGGVCKGVTWINPTGGKWTGLTMNKIESESKSKLVVSGLGVNKCSDLYSSFDSAAMCFCGA